MQKEIKKVAAHASANEKRIAALEASKDADDDTVKELKDKMKKLEDKVEKLEKDSSEVDGNKVLEEITARSSRERNLVVHKCPENAEESKEIDSVQGIFDKLDARMEAKRC